MIKRIMVALDGSAAAKAAQAEAARIAALSGAHVAGANVEDEMRFLFFPAMTYMEGGVVVPTPLPEEEYKKVEAAVKAESAEIRRDFDVSLKAHPGLKGEFISRRGNVNAILSEEARAVDLVVIGRRGKRLKDDRSTRPGPTTEAMVHDSLRPVLVVPANGRSGGTVVFAFDGSRAAQRVAVMGAYLSSLSKVPCHVITVDDDPEGARKTQASLLRYLEGYSLEPRSTILGGKAAKQVLDQADSKGAGLIVMGAFGHSPIRELLFGSTTLKVLEGATCPVLMMA